MNTQSAAMGAAHSNEHFVREAYDQFRKGGVGAVIHLFHDDIVWHVGGRNLLSRDWRGKYEVNDFFRQLMDLTLGSFEIVEVEDVLASDNRAAVLVRERARRNGRKLEMNAVHLWQLSNGIFTEFRRLPEDTYQDDEFWA